MLLEALQWMLTPCPITARRMGHLAESIAIEARARRCRAAWAPHLEHCRRALLDSARRCGQRRVALLLGSGPLLDVPLAELAAQFEEVWLVDLVHPLSTRRQVRRYPNVRLIVHDVSECLEGLLGGAASDFAELGEKRPVRFLDEPRIDWVASLNLLSQLPRLPLRWLGKSRPPVDELTIREYGDALMRNHLAYLARFAAPVCLVTDLEQVTLADDGSEVERNDLMPWLTDWEVEFEWCWDVAPPGELADIGRAWHRVGSLYSNSIARKMRPALTRASSSEVCRCR
jgi:hypothetical protein